MKQIGLSSLCILLLILFCIGSDRWIVSECREIFNEVQSDNTFQLQEKWNHFSKLSGAFTSNDLLQTADHAYRIYLAALSDNPNSSDTKTARAALLEAIEEIQKIHLMNFSRLF